MGALLGSERGLFSRGRADERSATAASGGPPAPEAVAQETPPEATDAAESDADRFPAPTLGANLNGRPRRLRNNLDLLDESNTTWVRAFFDVREKLRDGRRPEDDPDVVALRRAAREKDCKLIVNLKWGFKVNWAWDDKESMNVPEPGSERETELLACATRYLAAVDAPVDVVVLGNEPMWETKRADLRGEDPPIVRFTRTLKDHLVEHGDHGTPAYLLGAFNRLYDDRIRTGLFSDFCEATFRMAREDDDVDGVDLHLHYGRFRQARKMVRVAREAVPDGTITVTEFSPALRYGRHVRTPIGEWQAGREFAAAYGYSPDITAVDYFEAAKDDPRPPAELGAFYEAMPWYRADSLRRTYDLFEEFDVGVGTFGFVQDVGMRNVDWSREGWTPFHINFLYQQALLQGRGAHPNYIDDYRELAG